MIARFALGVVCIVALVSTAQGDIIFGTGNSPANQNIIFEQVDSTSATGGFNGFDVLLATSDVDMTVSAGGTQLEATDALLSSVIFTPTNSDWQAFELNPVRGDFDGTFVLKALDEDGNEFVSNSFALDNGHNRVFALAINGQSISQVTIEASGALIDEIKQVRIGGGAHAIPEPSTYAVIGLFSLFAFMLQRKKARAQSAP